MADNQAKEHKVRAPKSGPTPKRGQQRAEMARRAARRRRIEWLVVIVVATVVMSLFFLINADGTGLNLPGG